MHTHGENKNIENEDSMLKENGLLVQDTKLFRNILSAGENVKIECRGEQRNGYGKDAVKLRNRNMLKNVLENKLRKNPCSESFRHSWHAVSLSDVHTVSDTNLSWESVQANSLEDGLQIITENGEKPSNVKLRRQRARSNK